MRLDDGSTYCLTSPAKISPRAFHKLSWRSDKLVGGLAGGTSCSALPLTRILDFWPIYLYELRSGTRSLLTSTWRTTSLIPGASWRDRRKTAGFQSGWSSAANFARYHCSRSENCQRSSFLFCSGWVEDVSGSVASAAAVLILVLRFLGFSRCAKCFLGINDV